MIVTDYEGVEHDIAGEPDPDCYGCLGTGFHVGFGSNAPCHCKYTCERHEQACPELMEGENCCGRCGEPGEYVGGLDGIDHFVHRLSTQTVDCPEGRPER